LFAASIVGIVATEIRHPPQAVLDTPLLWIFVAMFNLLRQRNGYSVKNLKIFCVSANLATFTLEVVRLKMFGFLGLGGIIAFLILVETVFSLIPASIGTTSENPIGAAKDVKASPSPPLWEQITWRTLLLYLLPLLHLGACLEVWLTHDAEYIIFIDFPFSILFMVLGYQGVSLSLNLGILAILGTLWWYLLSLGIRRIVRFAAGHW